MEMNNVTKIPIVYNVFQMRGLSSVNNVASSSRIQITWSDMNLHTKVGMTIFMSYLWSHWCMNKSS